MPASKENESPKRPRGRPPKPIPKLDATPEEVARALFAAAKPPDLTLPKRRRECATAPAPKRVIG